MGYEPHFNYGRHFGLLGVAALVLFLFSRWDLFGEPFLPLFALSGALHASALCLALRSPGTAARKCSFIAIAAVMSVLTLYVGILSLQLLAILPANERLYLVLGICAMSGAITYGSLIRHFWMKSLSSRRILAIGFACAAATTLAFLIGSYWGLANGWTLPVAWWCAVSAGLQYFDRLAKQ